MRAEPVLDRRRRDILALAGLEQFLDAAGHAQAAVGIDLAAVAGMEEAVVRSVLGGLLRHLEIAEHLPRTFHENLVAVADPAFDARHRSDEHTAELQSLMRISYAVLFLKKKNNH